MTWLTLAVVVVLMVGAARGLTREDLYPYGPLDAPADVALPVGDDASTDEIPLVTPIAFYDDIVSRIYVSRWRGDIVLA